jgi:hypothetical protein
MRSHQTNTPARISFPNVQDVWPFPVNPVPIKTMTYLDDMLDHDIRICHGYNPENNRGGVTIAYRKCSDWRNTKMVEVSVAYCSSKDSFNKKIGVQLAVDRFMNGNTIMVPVRIRHDDTIVGNLLQMFWWNSHINL